MLRPGESLGKSVSEWRRSLRATVWALFVLAPLSAQEECGATWQIRRLDVVQGTGVHTTIDVDVASNARIASVADGQLWFSIIGAGSDGTIRFDDGALEDGGLISSASLETNHRGISSIVYTRQPGEPPETGRGVFLVETLGSSFTNGRSLSRGTADNYAARLVLDRRGEPHVAWAQVNGESPRVLYWNSTLGAPLVAVARGDLPALFLDHEDVAHIACLQGNDVLYVNNAPGDFGEPELITDSPLVPESSVSIGVLADDTVLVAYESESSLHLSIRDTTGSYLPPRRIAEGGVLDPQLRVKSDGTVLLAYSRHGDLWYTTGSGTELKEPRLVAATDERESSPSLDADSHGFLHLSFIRDGRVHYASTACPPTVDFSTDLTTGPDPLTVRFTDQSRGAIRRWQWDFGDGVTSGLRNPVHTYGQAGEFTVGLKVWGPGGVFSEKVVEDMIVVQDPVYAFRIPDQHALPGTKGLWFPVLGTNAEPVEGFQILGTYDPTFLTLIRSDLRSTALSANQIVPEFVETRIHEALFEIGVVFDVSPPFDGLTLPPGDRHRLIHLVFDVPETAPQGKTTKIRLVNDKHLSQIRNMMAVGGQARLPALKSSEVRIRPVEPPFPRLFVRGDFDSNGVVNLTDAVSALSFLFQSGSPPICLDAGDVNDSGSIGVSSIVALLNFLFAAGPAPAVPYPNAGLDPTDDELGECLAGDGSET